MSAVVAESFSDLSEDVRSLLVQAASEDGYILRSQTFEGWSIQTASKRFNDRGNPRSAAKWLSAIDELLQSDLITQSDTQGNVFRLTHHGYTAADAISGSSFKLAHSKRVEEFQERALHREDSDRRHSTYKLPVKIDLMPGEQRPCVRFDPPSPDIRTIEYFDSHDVRIGEHFVGGGHESQRISVPLDIDLLERIFRTSDTKGKEYALFAIVITYVMDGIDRTFRLRCRLDHHRTDNRHTAFKVTG
jgi:hypothetical protein